MMMRMRAAAGQKMAQEIVAARGRRRRRTSHKSHLRRNRLLERGRMAQKPSQLPGSLMPVVLREEDSFPMTHDSDS